MAADPRRCFVTPRWIILAVVFATSGLAQTAVSKVSPVFARYGIHADTGATATGAAALAGKLGPDVMASIDSVRSHVALIRNEGPHTIQDVVWIWTGITSDGQRVPMGGRTAIGSPEGIKPGDFLITGPSFPLAKLLMHRAKQPRADMAGLPAAVEQVRQNLSRYRTVEASLDVVLLDGGTVLGPDQYGLIDSRNATNAATAEISAKLNDSSISDADVDAWLAELGKRPFFLKPNGLPDHSSVIGNLAQGIRRQIQQQGRDKVARLLREVAARNAEARQLVSVKE